MEKHAVLLIFLMVTAVAAVGLMTEPSVIGDWHFKKASKRHYQPPPQPAPQRPIPIQKEQDANQAMLAQQMGLPPQMLIEQQKQEELRQRMLAQQGMYNSRQQALPQQRPQEQQTMI